MQGLSSNAELEKHYQAVRDAAGQAGGFVPSPQQHTYVQPSPPPSYDSPITAKLAALQEIVSRIEQQMLHLQARLEQSVLRSEPRIQENSVPQREQPPSSPLWRVLDANYDRLARLENELSRMLADLEV